MDELNEYTLPSLGRRGFRHRSQRFDHTTMLADDLSEVLGSHTKLDDEDSISDDFSDLYGRRLIHKRSNDKLDQIADRPLWAGCGHHCLSDHEAVGGAAARVSTPLRRKRTRAASLGLAPFRSQCTAFASSILIVDGSVVGL